MLEVLAVWAVIRWRYWMKQTEIVAVEKVGANKYYGRRLP